MPSLVTLVGSIASVLTISAFVPQVFRSWRTRSTRDLSHGTLILLVAQSAAWLSYGILVRDPPLIVTNGVVSLCTVLLLGAKLRFG